MKLTSGGLNISDTELFRPLRSSVPCKCLSTTCYIPVDQYEPWPTLALVLKWNRLLFFSFFKQILLLESCKCAPNIFKHRTSVGLSEAASICMASCLHNVDGWVHCPAVRPSPPSSIQIVGNWVLIECNREGKKNNNRSKLKYKEGTCWHSLQLSVSLMTLNQTLTYSVFPFFLLLSDSCLCAIPTLLLFVVVPLGFGFFSVKIAFITCCFQCQQLISNFCRSTSLEVKQPASTGDSKKKGDRDTYNSNLSLDEMASFHLFLALIAKQDYT